MGGATGDPDEDEEESKLWTELSSERVLRAVEAALVALHILTSPNMPKRVYLEDVIERIVQLARFQLSHSIYPAYDPVYATKREVFSLLRCFLVSWLLWLLYRRGWSLFLPTRL